MLNVLVILCLVALGDDAGDGKVLCQTSSGYWVQNNELLSYNMLQIANYRTTINERLATL